MKPIWRTNTAIEGAALPEQADVLIVGAGITGLTLAHRLSDEGIRPVVIESEQPAAGATGDSSAHLTSLFDSGYAKIESNFSEADAKLTAQSLQNAISRIENEVNTHGIDCGFARIDAWAIAGEAPGEAKRFEEEMAAARRAGLPLEEAVNALMPVTNGAAARLPDQARIDPARYVNGLARSFQARGGCLVTGTRMLDYSYRDRILVKTTAGEVEAGRLVLATHTPVGRHVVQARLCAMRTYMVAYEIEGSVPDVLMNDYAEPYHYLRRIERADGPPLLLVGGADHPVGGPSGDALQPFHVLDGWVKQFFKIKQKVSQWSGQYYASADGLPLIGSSVRNESILISTGYNGDGLTWGTVAGDLLTAQICGRTHPLAEVLTPRRLKLSALPKVAQIGSMFVSNLMPTNDSDDAVPKNYPRGRVEGGVAIYEESPEATPLHLSARCPHSGCVVRWNPVAHSWDCPCHGGRFDPRGRRIEGPPSTDLRPKGSLS